MRNSPLSQDSIEMRQACKRVFVHSCPPTPFPKWCAPPQWVHCPALETCDDVAKEATKELFGAPPLPCTVLGLYKTGESIFYFWGRVVPDLQELTV